MLKLSHEKPDLNFNLVLLFSCKSNSTKITTDSAANKSALQNQVIKPASTVHLDSSKIKRDSIADKAGKLIGFWVADGSENVTFEIRKNAFYYPEHFSSYHYKINGDSVKVQYDGFDQSFAYQLEGDDKLILVSADGERSVYSRKK